MKDINFIVFHEPTTFDVTGFVDVAEEFISTVKVINYVRKLKFELLSRHNLQSKIAVKFLFFSTSSFHLFVSCGMLVNLCWVTTNEAEITQNDTQICTDTPRAGTRSQRKPTFLAFVTSNYSSRDQHLNSHEMTYSSSLAVGNRLFYRLC